MVNAREFLTDDEIGRLRRRSNVMGALLVLHAWGLVGAAMALFALWPNPLTLLVGVVLVGGRQLGLAILMHDAAHGLLFRHRRLNDWVGRSLCAYPVASDMDAYRPYHLKHHRLTQQADDPDLVLSAPFPITRVSLRRKFVRDLTGQTFMQRRRMQLQDALGPAGRPWPERLRRFRARLGAALAVNVLMAVILVASGYWYLYLLLWLLPIATWYQLIARVRNIAEHAVVRDNDDALLNTRTTRAGWLVRLVLAPYRVNYHLEHHLFLFVPCWRLPAAHRLLLAKGYGPRMEIQGGYRDVLRLAASAAAGAPRREGGERPQLI
jgi:fatty acid desaturase